MVYFLSIISPKCNMGRGECPVLSLPSVRSHVDGSCDPVLLEEHDRDGTPDGRHIVFGVVPAIALSGIKLFPPLGIGLTQPIQKPENAPPCGGIGSFLKVG